MKQDTATPTKAPGWISKGNQPGATPGENALGAAQGESSVVDRSKETATEKMETVREASASAAETAKTAGRDAALALKEGAAETAESVRSSAYDLAEDRRRLVAAKVDDYSRAAQAAAEKLKADKEEALGKHLDEIAEKLHTASNYLSGHDVRNLSRDLGRVTREHPEIVLGGAALLGFAVTRFLKASSHEGSDQQTSSSNNISPALPAHYA